MTHACHSPPKVSLGLLNRPNQLSRTANDTPLSLLAELCTTFMVLNDP
jgi:hypothetical protein